jgi:hypothetical protein
LLRLSAGNARAVSLISFTALACLALPAAAAPPAASAQTVTAIVTDVDGQAHLAKHGTTRPLALLSALDAGDLVQLDRDARAVVVFPGQNGMAFDLAGPGSFLVQPKEMVARDRAARVSRRELPASLRALTIKASRSALASVTMRGIGQSAFRALGPSGRQLAQSARSLRWSPVDDGEGGPWHYKVRLIDDDGVVAFESDTVATSIELPEAIQLERESPYVWTVDAIGELGRRRSIATEFVVVDQATEASVLAARAERLDRLSDRVLFAIALDQSGLRQDAAAEWRSLAEQKPELKAFAR